MPTQIVTIADREADIYELFAMPRGVASDYLIRIHQDREVKLEPDGPTQSLKCVLRQLRPQGYFCLNLQRTPRREPREAVVSVQWTSVWVQPPVQHPQRDRLAPIQVQVLWAVEEECALEDEPVSWMLITTLPIATFEQACIYLRWYSYRWLIERYHFVLKSGCRVEQLQLATAERLERAIATFAIVAWRLLWLTYSARCIPNLPGDFVFETVEWQTLSKVVGDKALSATEVPTIRECVRWLAQLGGFLGRKCDGEPGAKTIWRGLRRLRDLVQQEIRRRITKGAITCS
jgi:hypothetical protein